MARKSTPEALPPLNQRENETECFDDIYRKYVQSVFSHCLSLTKDYEEAQDLTQDVFVKVFNKLDRFQHRSTIATWLYSITRHHCLDHIKLDKRLPTEPLYDNIRDNFADFDDNEALDERITYLEEFVKTLPSDDVKLLNLRYSHNAPIKKIARQLNLTESAVKMRLKRTRDKLFEQYTTRYTV